MDTLPLRFAISLISSSAIAARAYRRKSVALSGVFAGVPVMVVHMTAGYRFAALLFVFFATSSKVTRVGEDRKRGIDAEFKEGGQRNCIEAEYKSMPSTTKEIVHWRCLLYELGVHIQFSAPLFCDNDTAIKIANNPLFQERTKHIVVDTHFVRQHFLARNVTLPHIFFID